VSEGVLLKKVKITGTGHYAPETVFTNADLEGRVLTTDAWIREKLGISERRVAAPDECTSTFAYQAAKRAIENAGLTAADIDSIILATATPDRQAPATATKVQALLGATNASAFDMNAVCSGSIYALTVGAQFIRTGMSKHVLVIGADTFSRITDWTRRNCVFFGDGAGALVLSESGADSDFLCSRLYADGSGYEAFTVPAGGSEMPATAQTLEQGQHFFRMDGQAVYDTATKVIPDALRYVLNQSGLEPSDIDHVIPHQPSIRILQESARRIGIPFSKFHTNMDRYANTSSATIPLLLSEVNAAGKLERGQLVAFVAVGSGWTWGASVMRW
jgi:3-oxoacyl-[acyl-carrier-protein] synthase-3